MLNGFVHLQDPAGREQVPGVFPGWCHLGAAGSHNDHAVISHPIYLGRGVYCWQCPCCGQEYVYRPLDKQIGMQRCCRENLKALNKEHDRRVEVWGAGEEARVVAD